MKRTFVAVALLLVSLCAGAQIKWNQRYQEYFDQYKDVAIQQMLRYKIPASITLAQGVFESGAGQSELTRRGNNHFGIKCHGWTGRTTYHDDDARNECFRAYGTAYESFEDHSKFLTGSRRYSPLFLLKQTDYKGWARGLKECGYATNPQYAQKLIEIIQLYKLYQYDTATSYDHFYAERIQQGDVRYQIHEFNQNYYVIARRGDTFRTIADEVGISYRKLAQYNERDKRDVLEEGDIVFLKKKRTKAPKSYKDHLHYVKAGESMYSISQKYGIRLKSLYKLNHLSPYYQIRVGDALRLR
ncbi:MAG: glucosaminidase domain-containing protein [Prevotella sp.]|nr:glucosaminidase domain-containing protein [Prevotella sp.]